jgi:CCR4-NOT transcription complex subunit 4
VLTSADFPALNADVPSPLDAQPAEAPSPAEVSKEQAKAERKAAKKAAATERALERQKAAQEKAAAKAAEKARIAQEKAEKLAKEKEEKESLMREKAEKDRLEKERQVQEKADEERERAALKEKEKQALAEKVQAEKARVSQVGARKPTKSASVVKVTRSAGSSGQTPVIATAKSSTPPKAPNPVEQAPILSKMPKKNKPVTRPIKIPKEDEITQGDASAAPSFSASEPANFPPSITSIVLSSSSNSREESVDTSYPMEPISLACLLDEIDLKNPNMDLPNHPFFDMSKINPAAKMPLEYGPLVHALSALSVGGGSFATNMPSGSIDNAVSSFQQLLETLTQTISDLLRLLPRTTWDDSSSFDGVLRDMLKGDDFLDDGGDDAAGKEDEVAALTLALERRARWMEVQLSKLEELHRDINTAAVRAVLTFNDSGWDRHIFMPRVGNTLRRFDNIGMVEQGGKMRPMTVDELEKKLQVAKEAAIFAETEFREAMEKIQPLKPIEMDDY